MFCLKYMRSVKHPPLLNFLSRNRYSRRSDKNTSTYKVVKTDGENIDDMDETVLDVNSNWELLTPRGFRFYLPGSVGPGWSDVTTTAQVRTQLLDISNSKNNNNSEQATIEWTDVRPTLRCTAQECPLLLRKGIEELFPGCIDVGSQQLTIITIYQKTDNKTSRWSKEAETEKLAKYFVLAAYDICSKLKMIGYWADFINPFSGKPHLNLQKINTLYKTDERFRCLGFKIVHRRNCKIILHDDNHKNLIGSLYTTAPASTAFLKEILRDCEHADLRDS
ncbi:cobalamin trafficking protein CblD isoform X1 [Megalopta genalis]|uniref:cobalamin trafficking protein CblD isoform X1 n=2 Tax=Megalopta genalis TaxID=115081 RepID=UPI003FD61738